MSEIYILGTGIVDILLFLQRNQSLKY